MPTNLEDKVKELEAKVAELYDREALRDLRYRYHECINEAQVADFPTSSPRTANLISGIWARPKAANKSRRFSRASAAIVPDPTAAAVFIASGSSSITMS